MKNIFLAFLASLILTCSFAQPDNQREESRLIYQTAYELYDAKKYEEAGVNFEKAYELDRTNAYAAYNGACAYSLAGDKLNATKLAAAAYELGMMGFDADKDFDNVRTFAPFETVAKKARNELKALSLQEPKSVIKLPENFKADAKRPLIVALHGYGGSPESFANAYSFAVEKYNAIVLSIRATEVDGRNSFHWNMGEEEAERIKTEIDKAIKKYNIDKSKIMLTGFSQGGYLSWNFGLQNSELFCGLLPVAGSFDSEKTDLSKVKNTNIKVYSIIGKKDNPKYEATNMQAMQLGNELGLKFKVKNFYNIGHTYPANEEVELSKAFDWFLK